LTPKKIKKRKEKKKKEKKKEKKNIIHNIRKDGASCIAITTQIKQKQKKMEKSKRVQ
jgi:hypothetical protein